MGGLGSGRWGWHVKKTLTAHTHALDIRKLHKAGCLSAGAYSWQWLEDGVVVASVRIVYGGGRLELKYSIKTGRTTTAYDYPVLLSWTDCNYGGRRPWFHCPRCGRRVAKLYGGARFLCRKCHGLAYWTQRQSKATRAQHRADRLRERLGWVGEEPRDGWRKPKGMHWKTFERLADLVDEWEDLATCCHIGWIRAFLFRQR